MSAAPTTLPPPRRPGRYVVAVVCLGNICRSPTAAVVLRAAVADAGLGDRVEVVSGGTGGWHVGEPMDRRAAAALTASGFDPSGHAGGQVDAGWCDAADVVLAMDAANLADLRDLAGADADDLVVAGRLRLFRDADPAAEPGAEVPDPYYGGADGFAEVLRIVERTSAALVPALAAAVGPAGSTRSD